MATVLPTWKLELLEKKRRREEEEKKRAEEEYARSTAIPEWKRSLIHRRKVSSEEGPHRKDLSPVNSFVAQRKTFSNFRNDGSSDDKGENISPQRSKRDGTSQEGDEIGRIKGGGTSKTNGLDSGQAKDLKDDHIYNFSDLVENSGTGTDDSTSDSHNVAYEHVRRPSVVRLMFENATAPKFDGKVAGSSHKHVSPTNSFREAKSPSPAESTDTSGRLVSTRDGLEQSRSPQTVGLKPEHRQVQNSTADTHNKSVGGFYDADPINPTPQSSDIGVNGAQMLSSVKSLRNIFGGARERERTSSTENLPKAVGKDVVAVRPPSPRKRWSADVEGLMHSTEDLSQQSSNLNFHPPLHQRGRSVSLSDIREEQYEEHFKHKQNVASGLEKRLNKLIRQVSLSEGELEIENLSQSSDEDSLSDAPETFLEETEDSLLTEECEDKKGPLTEQSVFAGDPQRPKDALLNNEQVELSKSTETKADASKDDNDQVAKPSRGSVHKLSSLFGASIWNGTRKDKAKPDLQTEHASDSIANEKKQSTKETNGEAKVVQKERSRDRSLVTIPWLKNKVPVKNTENEIPKGKVQSERIHAATESVAPVKEMSHSAGRPGPYQGIHKNHLFNNKYKDTLERNKPKDVTRTVPKATEIEANNDRNTRTVHGNVPNAKESRVIESNKTAPMETTAVPVSAIDMPEPEQDDISVSVIDIPYSGVSVSVIDYPQLPNGSEGTDTPSDSSYLMSDELSDNSSDEEMEGSYTVTGLDERDSDEDEDEDEIPVSCIDDSPAPTIIVVFDTTPENVKSCMRPKNWKRKGKISFREHVVIHDYPSEECLAAAYDEMDGQGKTIQTYQPASITDIEQKIRLLQQQMMPRDKPSQSSVAADSADAVPDKPEITYAVDGQAFTDSSDSAGALLF